MKAAFIPESHRPYVPGTRLHQGMGSIVRGLHTGIKQSVVIISAKEDVVPDAFLKEVSAEDLIHRLYYDDLGTLWDFTYHQAVLKIFLFDVVLIPRSIYHRHPGVSENHPYYHRHIAFFEVLDLWPGNLIGQKRHHYHNTSKAYQAITSIYQARQQGGHVTIKYPHSFFVKGNFDLQDCFKMDMVVKSCSNMRSRVASKEEFIHWEHKNLSNLPTLFQEKIEGMDIRVHLCRDNFWTLLVKSKDCTDYRYASKGTILYEEIVLPRDVMAFCSRLAQVEENQFIGIDLMQMGETFFCLESNPGPGWSTFNHLSKRAFAQIILNELAKISEIKEDL